VKSGIGEPNDLRAQRARTGLEILPRHFSSPYSSVFSAFSIFPMAHSVAFGDDPLRGIGQSSGRVLFASFGSADSELGQCNRDFSPAISPPA
jgi:hypothetical protein